MVNYFVTTVASFVVTVLVAIGFATLAYNLVFHPSLGIEKNIDLINAGEYDKIDVEQIAGSEGSLVIYDDQGQSIYPENLNRSISQEEVDLVPSINLIAVTQVSRFEFNDQFNRKQVLLSSHTLFAPEDNWFILLDADYKVISTSTNFPLEFDSFTEEELKLVIDGDSDILSYKYIYEVDGKHYTMIISLSDAIRIQNDLLLNLAIFVPLVLLLAYFAATTTFMWLLNRRVTKPLADLDNAMLSFSKKENYTLSKKGSPRAISRIIDTFNDLTTKLNKSEEQNKVHYEERQALIADISHDLKTPVTIIKGYSKALADGVIADDEVNQYLQILARKSEELNDLIDMFHTYSKMEHPKHNLLLKDIDLCEMIRRYIANEYDYITSLSINFEYEIPNSSLICEIDEFELKRSISNLIMNAVRYNPKGTTVKILIAEDVDYVIIKILDDGIGIDEEKAKRIFEPFVTGDESRSSQHGSGLGLAITKTIIEKHHGNITLNESIESDYNTVFTIRLPKKSR